MRRSNLKARKEELQAQLNKRKGSHDIDMMLELLGTHLEIVKNALIVEPDTDVMRLMQGEARLCERIIADITRTPIKTDTDQ